MRSLMRRIMRGLLLVVGLLGTVRGRAAAQVKEAAIGGVTGLGGGVVATLAIVVARARFQGQYLDSAHDLIHWQTTPMIVGPAAGVVFGLAGQEVLVGSIVGSTSGLVVGAALGAGVGWLVSADPEGPWAGGVIGSGVGMTVGGLVGALRAWRRPDRGGEGPPPVQVNVRIPL